MEENELASIKKAGEVEHVSKEEFEYRLKSIVHSKRDICWWAENFFKIISLDKGLITIKLYEKQKELLHHFAKNDRSIVLAARQTGKCFCKNGWITIRYTKNGFKIKLPVGIFYFLCNLKERIFKFFK